VRLEDLDFDFPESLIAQEPCRPRDACRLLVGDPCTGSVAHRRFSDLLDLVGSGDVMVLNESKVFPARTWARRLTGGRIELLFLARRRAGDGGGVSEPPSDADGDPLDETWEALVRPSAKLREGEELVLPDGQTLRLTASLGDGRWFLTRSGTPGVLELLEMYGETPLPPYIRAPRGDADDYQTVYAQSVGSAAAPTAGLHFTEGLLGSLARKGVLIARVTLHVGVDTFRPITEGRVEDHVIHSEEYRVSADVLETLDGARAAGRRVIAVGTTSVRVLETLYGESRPGAPATGPREGATRVYITPGYEFRATDALLTNFHLPRTSLLALVMAFGGSGFVRECYEEAVRERYRFFSFGDAMLLTSRGRAE
jgi:S-adenosylmethionine:tRNA ribosyltransferase-isomerase